MVFASMLVIGCGIDFALAALFALFVLLLLEVM